MEWLERIYFHLQWAVAGFFGAGAFFAAGRAGAAAGADGPVPEFSAPDGSPASLVEGGVEESTPQR